MSDDDDWFEQALREEGEDAADAADETDGDASASKGAKSDGDASVSKDADSDGDVPPGADRSKNDGSLSDGPERDETAGEALTDPEEALTDPEATGGTASTGAGDPVDPDAGESEPGVETTDSGGNEPASGSDATTSSDPDPDGANENPFDQDFATALENAPDPGTDQPSGFGGGSNEPSPGGSDDDFGFGDFDGEGQSSDAFGFGGAESEGEAFGFGGGEEEFDEEEFDSELDRLDIGIDGLDDMILGGVPRRSLMVAVGSAGTGKTTFGLQFLNHGLENGESAVYITLEESYERILDTAGEKGWDFEGYVDEDRLAVVDIDPIEMANSLDSIQNDLPGLIEEFGADRLVLDSVSLLEMMYESAPKRRSQVFGFTRALKNAGITTLLTSEASEDNPYTSRFGIVEYLADAVFVLQYVRESDFRETRLAIEIQKIRDANHSRATKPYELTESGISVYRQANIF